jgi:hypothetical protein
MDCKTADSGGNCSRANEIRQFTHCQAPSLAPHNKHESNSQSCDWIRDEMMFFGTSGGGAH